MIENDPGFAELVEAGAAGMYGKKWNSPKDDERPGEKMKDVWRKYARDCLAGALAKRREGFGG